MWFGVFYWLANYKWKVIFERLIWVACCVTLVNYMFYGTEMGMISSNLQYESRMSFKLSAQLLNLLVVTIIALACFYIATKYKTIVIRSLFIALIAIFSMCMLNGLTIKKSIDDIVLDSQDFERPKFQLSKTGKNVVVIVPDRALGQAVPYILKEKPYLEGTFDGFTYYNNTISFGRATNFGFPAIAGGYEYTPLEMNKRNTESLVEKHNEALKVLPVLFDQNGYDVTVCDPAYANYKWIPDLSIYDDYPRIKSFITNYITKSGAFHNPSLKLLEIDNKCRTFFCFGIMKTMPLFMQPTIYNEGRYNQSINLNYSVQVQHNISFSEGIDSRFMNAYNVLDNLADITQIKDTGDTFLFLYSDITHAPTLLQTPDYIPSIIVNNKEYDKTHNERFFANGVKLKVNNNSQMSHYHANMAFFIQIGEWLDYLKENGVYDNTRIILVSDHGFSLAMQDEMMVQSSENYYTDMGAFYPLLMVKDFYEKGFSSSSEFMTNADVPYIAVKGIIEDAKNPFSGKPIISEKEKNHRQYIVLSEGDEWRLEYNKGNEFSPTKWIVSGNNIFSKDNWIFINEKTTRPDIVN